MKLNIPDEKLIKLDEHMIDCQNKSPHIFVQKFFFLTILIFIKINFFSCRQLGEFCQRQKSPHLEHKRQSVASLQPQAGRHNVPLSRRPQAQRVHSRRAAEGSPSHRQCRRPSARLGRG